MLSALSAAVLYRKRQKTKKVAAQLHVLLHTAHYTPSSCISLITPNPHFPTRISSAFTTKAGLISSGRSDSYRTGVAFVLLVWYFAST